MFNEEFSAVVGAARNKVTLLKKNPIGYFMASVLAGMFVGFGILLIFTIGGLLNGQPYAKILMGVSFGIALSLVVIAGAELFTGNNLVLTAGIFGKSVTLKDTIYLWVVCWLGNLAGSVLLAAIFAGSGAASESVGTFIASSAAVKMSLPAMELFLRAILCNILICLATWCTFRCKSESGKLIMVFWCLFAFITCGFEHSVANMTLLSISLFKPYGEAVSVGGTLYNLLMVSAGNMVGGILFTAIPYYIISKKKEV